MPNHDASQPRRPVAIPILNGILLLSLLLTWYGHTEDRVRHSGLELLFAGKLFAGGSPGGAVNSGSVAAWMVVAALAVSCLMTAKTQWQAGPRAFAVVAVGAVTLMVVVIHMGLLAQSSGTASGSSSVIAGDGSNVAMWSLALLAAAWIEYAWRPRLSKYIQFGR